MSERQQVQYIILMGAILAATMWLTSCGYRPGDLDRGLECIDGCDPKPEVLAPKDGRDGVDGKDGIGSPGPAGLPGEAGKDGQGVTYVTACAALPGAYPEVLQCAAGSLYATMVENGSRIRTTRLIVGATYSTTDGRVCIFKVLADCEVETL